MAGKLSKVNLNDYKPLREVIFNTLKEAIIVGELKPGTRLMEVQLAEKMGVSRTPVREAIRKLELEGLVTMVPRKGAHVASLSPKDIVDVLEVRAALDGLAASLSSLKMKEDQIKELRQINKQFANFVAKENLQGSIKKDVEFHELIYRSSGNEKLMQIVSNLREQVQRFRVIYLKDYSSQKDIESEHEEIIEAIAKKDPEAALNAAKRHIKNQEIGIINAIKKQEMDYTFQGEKLW
ncbi:MAG TPA: GntR family transcriptional regulator [Clostridiaceae bacterium]|nr:GntR family transcriptional regulator [Clostridiaceae bacterium]